MSRDVVLINWDSRLVDAAAGRVGRAAGGGQQWGEVFGVCRGGFVPFLLDQLMGRDWRAPAGCYLVQVEEGSATK